MAVAGDFILLHMLSVIWWSSSEGLQIEEWLLGIEIFSSVGVPSVAEYFSTTYNDTMILISAR